MAHRDAKDKESYDNQTSFHLFPPAIFHKAQASTQQPRVPATDSSNASTPSVGKALMICSLPPTSTPSRKSNSHIKTVITLSFAVCTLAQDRERFFRSKYPLLMPKNMNRMTLNTWSSFQITQLLHLCPAKPLFHPKDVGEVDKADAYPQQHALNEWTNAHGAQCGACERCTDKE